MKRALLGITGLAALAFVAVPASASADTVTLSQNEGGNGIVFAPGDPSIHPADIYPSTITGPAGTVNDVNVSVTVNHANPADLDVQLVSPAGTGVFLFSDTCGNDAGFNVLKFDDAASLFLPTGLCDASQTYDVTNQNGMDSDIYSAPAPATLPLNALSNFNGQASGGGWKLFGMDDTTLNGGAITTWSITFDFTPTPPVTPEIPVVPPTPVPTCPKGKKLKNGKCVKKKKKKRKK